LTETRKKQKNTTCGGQLSRGKKTKKKGLILLQTNKKTVATFRGPGMDSIVIGRRNLERVVHHFEHKRTSNLESPPYTSLQGLVEVVYWLNRHKPDQDG